MPARGALSERLCLHAGAGAKRTQHRRDPGLADHERVGSASFALAQQFHSCSRAIRPRVIDVVTVRPGDTVQSLAGRMAYRNFQAERFLSLNGLPAGARLVPGQRVKLVVYGNRAR